MKLIKLLFICTWFLAAGLGAQEETKDGGVPAVKTSLDHNLSLQEVELLVVPLTLEQLQAEADDWQQYVQDAMTEIANLKVAALSAKGEELDAIYQQLNKLTEERAATIAKLRLIIDSMTLKGAPAETTEPYRQYVKGMLLSLIHISEPTRPFTLSRMPSSA